MPLPETTRHTSPAGRTPVACAGFGLGLALLAPWPAQAQAQAQGMATAPATEGLARGLAWATTAGAAPLAVYAAGLLLATLMGLLLWWLVRPAAALPRPADVGPGTAARPAETVAAPEPAASLALTDRPARTARDARQLVWRLGLAAAVLLLAGAGLTAVGGQIAPEGAVGRWDDAFSTAMAPQRSPGLLAVFAVLSHAGDARVVTAIGVVVALALWRAQHRLLALAWTVALLGNGLFTRLFKAWWARERPLHDHDLAVVSGHSFPSGHASASAVVGLWLACLACWLLPSRWRLSAAVLACALAWTVAYSRVVLNVHHASDVLSGLLLGSAWALASGLAVRGLLRWQRAGQTGAARGGRQRVSA